MKDFFAWYRDPPAAGAKPWCILGKGPSFSRRAAFDLAGFNLLSLNHVVRELKVDVAHFIDLDAALACARDLAGNAGVVVMPWRPHVANVPGPDTLDAIAAREPALAALAAAGRLVWYNLATAKTPNGSSPVVPVEFFSAEAALALLAIAGARTVRSLGVDGGAAYAGEFADLTDATLLANRRASFDKQFASIARVIRTTGVDYAPLDVEAPVRVYVAATEAQMVAVKVLEYSIRRHASLTVTVMPLHESGVEIPVPKDPANRARTPFSFQRFLIPRIAGFNGRAIYLDSDMQVFRDIRELWTVPMDGADLLAARARAETDRRPQFSVMLLDCAELKWDITDIVSRLDAGELNYAQLMAEMRVAPRLRAGIAASWNSLELYEEGITGLVHYTDMPTQPWVALTNPLGYLWVRDLLAAVKDGAITRAFIADHVAKGWVRPSLLWQVDNAAEDPLLLPRDARALDKGYAPPWTELGGGGSPLSGAAHRVRALLRQAYLRSPIPALRHRFKERFFPE